MALEQLTLAAGETDGRQPSVDGGAADDGAKVARLPRWTRQEILVLINGKRFAETRLRRGRVSGLSVGSVQVEPKWVTVSAYCKTHGVNRGPVQCRKRWSNLAGDFKKIKEWESKTKDDKTESFWVMRNDLRRERKLPGFFDREVYDILDGGGGDEEDVAGLTLALAPSTAAVVEEGGEEEEALFDSGRSVAADDELFSDFEQPGQEETGGSPGRVKETPVRDIPAPTPISVAEKQYQPFPEESARQGTKNEKQATSEAEVRETQEGRKRKRYAADGEGETENLHRQLIEALERNGKLLGSQLEAQNTNLQLDREQRKDHVNSLITVLNKLADAMGRIADKL